MVRKQRISALSIVLAVLFCLSMGHAQDGLILVVTLIRHGDRMPIYSIKSSPINWKLGPGELTPLGMNQEYQLGKSFRARYVDQLGFLPPQYGINKIYVRSTDYNRTIMSAQSFLCGLYPPGTGPTLDNGDPALPDGYQPIPVKIVPEAHDRILLGTSYKERFEEMVREYVIITDEWIKMTSSCSDKFDRWSKIFAANIRDLLDLILPADDLNVRMLKGVQLPEGLTEAEAREIVKCSQWALAQKYKPRNISCLLARDFMHEIVTHMEKAMEGTQPYRFILYSGHDTTLLSVLSMLGTPLEYQPPYNSNVSFELYRNKEGYFVKVLYNENDITIHGNMGRTPCPFERFRKIILDESW